MFQATRCRLALWYTSVTAVLLLCFASGFYLYVRTTLVERVDDTLNHVLEVVQRSLVIEPGSVEARVLTTPTATGPSLRVNVEASFRDNAQAAEDDHIDLEWFSPQGTLLWSTLSEPLPIPLHVNPAGETVSVTEEQVLRQITRRVQAGNQVVGYLRVSHPWFEVTKPTRRLLADLSLGICVTVGAVAAIGWLLSGLAIAPVRDSYQQLKQFTADASHELRNPIAVIQTNVQVALADPNPNPQAQQGQLQVIERLTRRLGRLVDDLLFLARQDGGLTAMQWQAFDLNHLLADVIEEQQAIAQDQTLHLSYQPPATILDAEATIMGDPDQITRLFTNLISNSLQYTPAAGTVTVTLSPDKHQGHSYWQVRICDSGIGIPAAALTHVFDRFYRVDPARAKPCDGQRPAPKGHRTGSSGLGLAIAQVIVQNHKGQIQIDSVVDKGTTVTVWLPMASPR
ncbi:sensor histidine kinase [Halomicronema hongdechloris]|nr:HAMP domain-containing sensor histidine kinase [Halomicronema hongdechloris]